MADEWNYVLQSINDTFPDIQITKHDLSHPTSSMVVNVYNNFVTEFEEKVQFLAGSYHYSTTEFNDNLDAEERLFYTMYHIFNTFALDIQMITLSDIYDPVPIRTKNFFKICLHLLTFAESILEDSENLASSIIKMKENTIALENENEELLLEIHQKATKKAELIETKEKLNQELLVVKHSHEEIKHHVKQKEIVYFEKRKEIELLKQQQQAEEQELNRLENKEKELSEQSITESEYKNLIKTYENFETEYKSLGSDQINMDDLLVHENDELLHYQDIRKRVPEVKDLDLDVIETLIHFEEELKNLQLENEKVINNVVERLKIVKEQSEITLEEINQQIMKETQEYEEMLKKMIEDDEKHCQEIIKQKDKYETFFNHQTKIIQSLKDECTKLRSQRDKLRSVFHSQYIRIAKADAAAKEYFKYVLSKLN